MRIELKMVLSSPAKMPELPNADFTVGQIVFSHNGNTLGVCGGTRGLDQESMIKLYSLLR